MATIKSVFGDYAARLQTLIDESLNMFAPTWFQNYFVWGAQQATLTYESMIGRSRIEAAASVIARGSRSPLRGRMGLEKLTGVIPQISEKFGMNEDDYRNFLLLQQIATTDAAKKQQLLDLMFGDVVKVGNSAMKRLDYMCLEGISTGQITLTTTNNPDGVVLQEAVDLLMPVGNKINPAISWDSTTATPFTDIMNVVNTASLRGISFASILMTRPRFFKMIKTTEVKDYVGNFINVRNLTKVLPTLNQVNDFLAAQLYPPITIVDFAVGIEKDGVISTARPFKDENVVFIPSGNLGTIRHSLCIEEVRPVENVSYSKYNNALISKFAENEPFREYTKVELNAVPSIDAIDAIYLLLSTTVGSS